MPRRFKRRRRRRRRTARHSASQAYQLARKAYRLTDHETMNQDAQAAGNLLLINAPAAQILINSPGRGTGPAAYQGRKYFMTSMLFTGSLQRDVLAVAGQLDLCRVIVVYDKVPNGVAFAVDQLLDPDAIASLDTYVQASTPYNRDSIKRFTVLYDKMFQLDLFHPGIAWKARIRIMKSIVTSGNAADITDIETGAVYALFFSSAAGTEPEFHYTSRLFFRP